MWYVIGYILIGLVMAGLMTPDYANGREVTKDVMTSIFWPLILVTTLVWAFVALVSSAKQATQEWINKEKVQ